MNPPSLSRAPRLLKKISWIYFLLLLFFINPYPSDAQHGADTSKFSESDIAERSLILSVDYGSDKFLYGRSTNTKVPYFAPSLSYEAPSGFFSGITVYDLLQPDSVRGVDEIDFVVGWGFTLFKKLNAWGSYSHYRFSKDSPQLRSVLKNQLELYLSPDIKIITPRLYADYLFSDTTHYVAVTLEIMHEFTIENLFTDDNDALLIKPQASLYLGTLSLYSFYRKKFDLRLSPANVGVSEEKKFGVTGVEFSLPVEYRIGRFIIEIAPRYNLPINHQEISLPKFPKIEKALNDLLIQKPVFYFTATVGFYII